MEFQTQTARLFLRPVTLEDADSYQKNFSDYEVIRHLSYLVPWPYPKDGAYNYIKDVIIPKQGKNHWVWGVTESHNKSEIIGVVQLWRPGTPENRGFWLAHKHWGKGYMTEAVEAVMHIAFNQLNFDKLTFANAVGNHRSRRIKEKTGAKLIDVRPAKFVDPKYNKHEIWELNKQDWLKFKSS